MSAEQFLESVEHLLPVEEALDAHDRGLAHALAGVPVGDQDLHGFAQGRGVPRGDEQAGLTVGQHTGLRPNRVELLAPGALPKTTSGKLQRSRVRAAYAAGRGLQPPQPSRTETLRVSARSLLDLALARARRLFGWR